MLFICATDEHGTPAELAAAEAGMDVAEFCAQAHDVQRDLCERFGLSFDWFGRTSAPQNHELTNHMARRLREQGYCEIRTTAQVYSVTDGRFLPDRYVEGTCPNCGYDRARGDQCEHCGKQLDPTELIDARSAISGSTDLEVRDSAHVFLLQSQLADRLRAWIDTKDDWPQLTRSIAYKWLDEGLGDRGITRDLDWGITSTRRTSPRSPARSGTSGSMRRSATWVPPGSGPTQAAVAVTHRRTSTAGGVPIAGPTTSPTPSSWARTTCPSTP